MLKADLHIHSTVSDGTNSITEIIEKAIANGLNMIAITDHDTLSHAKQIPNTNEIKVMAGIEISAFDSLRKTKAHILGYGIKDTAMVERLTAPLLRRRHENSLRQIEILRNNWYSIDEDALMKADGKYIYKQHIMEHLVQTGQVKDMFGEFYQRVFKNGGICDFDIEYVDVYEAVQTITKAGGKAVLAHSGQQQNFYLINELVPLGLAGIEYNHPHNSEEDKRIIVEYGQQHDLFLTGGSDYHGGNAKIPCQIGSFLSPESGIMALWEEEKQAPKGFGFRRNVSVTG